MSNYKITEYSKRKAKENNLVIKKSTHKNKKLDVFENGLKVASIGSTKYLKNDYPTYLETKGKKYADERRRLYKLRHKNDLNSQNGYYANLILW